MTDRDIVLLPLSPAHSVIMEGQGVVAAVVDVPDDVGGGGGEGGEVAEGAGVQPGDAAGEIDLPPVLRVL